MNILPRRASPNRFSLGFSLVEVALALGILSFSLLTILGLTSVGLRTFRDAIDATTSSQIIQTIAGEARLTAYTNLDLQFANKVFYFDEEGSFLTNSPAPAPNTTRYWVTTSLTNAAFPGSANATAQTPLSGSLRSLSIQVVAAANQAAKNKTTTYLHLMIPNSGG